MTTPETPEIYTRETHPHYANYANEGCAYCRQPIGGEPFTITATWPGDECPITVHVSCIGPVAPTRTCPGCGAPATASGYCDACHAAQQEQDRVYGREPLEMHGYERRRVAVLTRGWED